MKNKDNIISLVSKANAENKEDEVGKKDVIEFLQSIIDDVKNDKRLPFDKLLVLGHTWDEDKYGFTLYRHRLGMSGLESISTIEMAKALFMDEILN